MNCFRLCACLVLTFSSYSGVLASDKSSDSSTDLSASKKTRSNQGSALVRVLNLESILDDGSTTPAPEKRSRSPMTSSAGSMDEQKQMADFFKFAMKGDVNCFKAIQLTAEKGDRLANFFMARFYMEKNKHVLIDLDKALTYLDQPCCKESSSSNLLKAKIHLTKEEYFQALECLKNCNALTQKATGKNNPEACYLMGKMHMGGVLGSSNLAEALQEFQKAALLDYPEAVYKLSFLHYCRKDQGIEKYSEAIKWLSKALVLYEKGQPQDKDKLTKALADCEFRISSFYYLQADELGKETADGLGLLEKGMRFRMSAAEKGHEEAKNTVGQHQFELSQIYKGLALRSVHTAFKIKEQEWLIASCLNNNANAISAIPELFKRYEHAKPYIKIRVYEPLANIGYQPAKEVLPELYSQEAQEWLREKNFAKAEEFFTKAINAGKHGDLILLGNMLLQNNEVEKADNAYREALRRGLTVPAEKLGELRYKQAEALSVEPETIISVVSLLTEASLSGHAEATYKLARLFCEDRIKNKESSDRVAKCISRSSILLKLGAEYVVENKLSCALRCFRLAAHGKQEGAKPFLVEVLYAEAGRMQVQGNFQRAAGLYKEAIGLKHNDSALALARLVLKSQFGHDDLKILDEVIADLKPLNLNEEPNTRGVVSDLLIVKAKSYLNRTPVDLLKVIQVLREALELSKLKEDDEIRNLLVTNLIEYARTFLSDSATEDSLHTVEMYLNEAQELKPSSAETLLNDLHALRLRRENNARHFQ